MLEVKVPTVGESINEVTLGSWNKKTGDFVNLDEVLVELESDKATFEVNAPVAGILHIVADEGTTLTIGSLICKIEAKDGVAAAVPSPSPDPAVAPSPNPAPDVAQSASQSKPYPSPAAAKILDEKGIDSSLVNGSGRDGRITKEDALKANPAPAKTTEVSSQPKVSTESQSEGVTRKRMTTMRKTIARRLVQVKNETAMLTTFNEVDMKPLMDLRGKYKDEFQKKYNVKLGFMSFFTKAAAQALIEFPNVNAIIDGDEFVYHDYANVSIAVSTPKGLVVPVLRNAHLKSYAAIEQEIIELAVKARDGKISIEDMEGGTFTITNGGIFGSMLSTPIINSPQSAILGMHNIVERPVVVGGQIVIRPIMYLALSYDHRIVDGKDSVSFLVRIKELIEDPSRLLLGV